MMLGQEYMAECSPLVEDSSLKVDERRKSAGQKLAVATAIALPPIVSGACIAMVVLDQRLSHGRHTGSLILVGVIVMVIVGVAGTPYAAAFLDSAGRLGSFVGVAFWWIYLIAITALSPFFFVVIGSMFLNGA
jgi:hypothetical protein